MLQIERRRFATVDVIRDYNITARFLLERMKFLHVLAFVLKWNEIVLHLILKFKNTT